MSDHPPTTDLEAMQAELYLMDTMIEDMIERYDLLKAQVAVEELLVEVRDMVEGR